MQLIFISKLLKQFQIGFFPPNFRSASFFKRKTLSRIFKLEPPSHTHRYRPLTSNAQMIADTLTNTHCFTSAFDPLPCPDSWCPPWGPLRLSSLITTVQPPTLHSARDYPPLPLALAFTPLSRCFTNCWILSLSCSLSYLSCRSAQPRLSET